MKIAALGIVPASAVLETRGRTSGLVRRVPIVIGRHGGQRYLVSMLGPGVDWIRNAEVDDGRAVLVHGRHEPVRLVEVPVEDRAPIIKDYLRVAPGARPHIRVDRKAPVAEFATVAGDHPVFRIVPE